MKCGKIQSCRNFGSADGPRVRGRRSPVYEVCHPKLRSAEKGKRRQSAYGPRTVRPVHRLPSNTPVMCSLSKEWTVRQGSADGPPVLRKNLQKQFQWEAKSEIIKADGPPGGREQSAPVQNCGTGHPWTYMPRSLSLSTKPTPYPQKLSFFLSQARGGDIKVKVVWCDSRTVPALPRTLLVILHHVLSVFQ